MPASSVVPVPVPPPPPAYPDPIHLPVSPHGDPAAARSLADAYRALADRLDHTAKHVDAITADLATRWHGQGATALRLPSETLADNLHTLSAAYRAAADHLDDYADALHQAQHRHGWSLGKIVAIGAIVTITAVAVVVTVGAAAPVGTLAAAEVGEAIVGAEAAAAGATAAETAATTGLSLTTQAMTGLRSLTAMALPHLTQGTISTGIDTGLHLATGRGISARELSEAFLAGTLGSATTSATRSALRSSEVYGAAGTASRAALDTSALTATLTADTALGQYATTGNVNPAALTEDALLTALTGGAATLRHPLDGTLAITRRTPRGQSLADLMRDGFDPLAHEGPYPWGHAIARHVGQTEAQLRARLAADPALKSVSSFYDVGALTHAGNAALRRYPFEIAEVMSGARSIARLKVRLPSPVGIVLPRGNPLKASKIATLIVVRVGNNVVVKTAFVEAK